VLTVLPTPEFSHKAKASIGVEMDHQKILIVTMVTDGDGTLGMKRVEAFEDSKATLKFAKAVAEARENRHSVAQRVA
jgi:hypothetical protein